MSDHVRVVCLDLGGTRLKAGVVEPDTGTVSYEVRSPTAGLDGSAATSLAAGTAAELAECSPGVVGVGLAVPGTVEHGVITSLPGKFPGIEGRDLRAAITSGTLPVVVVNDAVAYAVGEASHGAGQGASRVVVVTIGTGVGVCVVEDGAPLGAGALGGGILGGQIPLGEPEGPADTSGRRGTVEARCRAEAMVAYARDEGLSIDGPPALYAAAAEGQPAARAAVATYRRWLARGLVALAHAHAPDVLVLGGGPVVAHAPILDGLAAAMEPYLWRGYRPPIRPAALGDHAALLGLATLVRSGGQR